MKEVVLPELAEGVNEATISYWHFEEGENIEEGADLVEMMTDKATFNVPAPSTGTLTKRMFEEGEVVKVGAVLATIEEGE